MSRRKFLTTGAAWPCTLLTGIITSAPAIAQNKTKLTIVSTWPRDFPGLGMSAQRWLRELLNYRKVNRNRILRCWRTCWCIRFI